MVMVIHCSSRRGDKTQGPVCSRNRKKATVIVNRYGESRTSSRASTTHTNRDDSAYWGQSGLGPIFFKLEKKYSKFSGLSVLEFYGGAGFRA